MVSLSKFGFVVNGMSTRDAGFMQLVVFFRELHKQRLHELAETLPAGDGTYLVGRAFERNSRTR